MTQTILGRKVGDVCLLNDKQEASDTNARRWWWDRVGGGGCRGTRTKLLKVGEIGDSN